MLQVGQWHQHVRQLLLVGFCCTVAELVLTQAGLDQVQQRVVAPQDKG